jgi:hypothetical protein
LRLLEEGQRQERRQGQRDDAADTHYFYPNKERPLPPGGLNRRFTGRRVSVFAGNVPH